MVNKYFENEDGFNDDATFVWELLQEWGSFNFNGNLKSELITVSNRYLAQYQKTDSLEKMMGILTPKYVDKIRGQISDGILDPTETKYNPIKSMTPEEIREALKRRRLN